MRQKFRYTGYLEMAENGPKWPKISKRLPFFDNNAMK